MIIKYQKIARYVLFCTLNYAQHELSNSYEQIVVGFLFAELVSGGTEVHQTGDDSFIFFISDHDLHKRFCNLIGYCI